MGKINISLKYVYIVECFFFFQAEDGIRDGHVTGVQTCALPIYDIKPDTRFGHLGDRYLAATVYNGVWRSGHRQHKRTTCGDGSRYDKKHRILSDSNGRRSQDRKKCRRCSGIAGDLSKEDDDEDHHQYQEQDGQSPESADSLANPRCQA